MPCVDVALIVCHPQRKEPGLEHATLPRLARQRLAVGRRHGPRYLHVLRNSDVVNGRRSRNDPAKEKCQVKTLRADDPLQVWPQCDMNMKQVSIPPDEK